MTDQATKIYLYCVLESEPSHERTRESATKPRWEVGKRLVLASIIAIRSRVACPNGEIAPILATKSGEWAVRWISNEQCCLFRSPQTLCFSHWGERITRVTADEAQGTMERRKKGGEAPPRSFSPSRLSLRANFHRGRGLWVRGSEQCWKKPLTRRDLPSYYKYHVTGSQVVF